MMMMMDIVMMMIMMMVMMAIMMVLMIMMMIRMMRMVRLSQEKATRQDGDCCGVKILVKFGTVTFVIIIIVIIIIISMITMIMIIHLNICPRSTSAIDNKCKARTLFRSGNHGDEISGW